MKEIFFKELSHLEKHWASENTNSFKEASLDSKKKYYWKCAGGHSFLRGIRSFSRSSTCPFCSGRKSIPGISDLQTTHPNIAKNWDFERNKTLDITDFKAGAKRKVWWRCPKGHARKREIYVEVRYEGRCPTCIGRKIVPGLNDLEHLFPDLAKMWSERNSHPANSFAPNSAEIAWWICENGHEFKRRVFHQTRGDLAKCPHCPKFLEDSMNTVSFKNSVWNDERSPKLFAPKSNKKVLWKCVKKDHEFIKSPKEMQRNEGVCPICVPNGASIPEEIVKNLLRERNISFKENQRILKGKELDIILTDYNKAIEINGEHWHSNALVKNKSEFLSGADYHLYKIAQANQKGFELAFIWTHDLTKHPDVLGELFLWIEDKILLENSVYLNRLTSVRDTPCLRC